MKYKVGDKVRIKSKEWWDAQPKNVEGSVDCGSDTFTKVMIPMCGKVCEISEVFESGYAIKKSVFNWTDEMFEGLASDEKPTISTDLIKDIAEVVRTHNLGVSVSEQDGKLIIEPLKVEEDLPIGTPVIHSNNKDYWAVGIYQGFGKVSMQIDGKDQPEKRLYIIPYNLFNPNDIEESLKHNIVKQ